MKGNYSLLKKNQFFAIPTPVCKKEVNLWLFENDDCYSIFVNVVWRYLKSETIYEISRKEYLMPKSAWVRKDVMRRYSNLICKYKKTHDMKN